MTPLRLAVVGTGRLGQIHARLAAKLPEYNLVVVVDPDADARQRAARELGAQACADHRDLFGLADAVVVAAPTSCHHPIASELLRGGLHVLVEKPLAPTAEQADDLVRLARRNQVVLQTGHVERFNPALLAIEGRLHSPKYIEARRTSSYTFRGADVGVVLDLMIHDIDLTLALAKSEVVRVEAFGVSIMGGHEDMATARLHFACGAVAQLTASRTSFRNERIMHVFTPQLFAALDFAEKRTTVVEPRADVLRRTFAADKLDPAQQALCREKLFDDVLSRHDIPTVEVNAIEEELRDFARAIRTGAAPRASGEAGRDAVGVAERIVEAIQLHAWDAAGRYCGPHVTPPIHPPGEPWIDLLDDTVVVRPKAA